MMMSEESPIQIPNAMRWRFKTIRKLLKETVPMTPNNGICECLSIIIPRIFWVFV